jgi:iron complex outermembrane receptor protein
MPYDDWDYKVGLEYDINDTSMLFANYSTSYRIEGEAMDKDGNTHPPQEIEAYSAGVKNTFLDNRLLVNLSGYYYDYTGRVHMALQFASINPDGTFCPGGPPAGCIFRPDEGGRVPGDLRMYGADLQTEWLITRNDRLGFSLSYLNSDVTHMVADYEFKDQPTYDGNQDFSDSTPTFSPDWTITLDYSHDFYLPNDGVLTPRVDFRYQSEYVIDWLETRMGRDQRGYIDQEAHSMTDITLTYTHSDAKWRVTGYVKNVFDYAEKRFMNMGMDMTIGPPRTYGILLSARF